MTDNDFSVFSTMWGQAWEQCGKIPTAGAIELAFEALRDYPLHVIRNGLIGHIRDPRAGQFPPKVADVIRHIEGGHMDDKEARAGIAWRIVLEHINTYESAVFDDPAVHFAIAVAFGSWERLGMIDQNDAFARRDFMRAYMAWKPNMPYPRRMIGRLERESAIGDAVFETRYIGDRAKCNSVESGGSREPIGKIGLIHAASALHGTHLVAQA